MTSRHRDLPQLDQIVTLRRRTYPKGEVFQDAYGRPQWEVVNQRVWAKRFDFTVRDQTLMSESMSRASKYVTRFLIRNPGYQPQANRDTLEDADGNFWDIDGVSATTRDRADYLYLLVSRPS